ncbi:hypothetical protein B7P43_G08465 [Cryptotermes secundus]|uniref:C2H2-type domain-containing protein n=1 Tax=Cryptotermes secundus TaxID=105785 RepID=A0A2J7R5Z1_9NEOP|nr:hypothetical protein B7P43_G08465 [Cryptotermes secundus]
MMWYSLLTEWTDWLLQAAAMILEVCVCVAPQFEARSENALFKCSKTCDKRFTAITLVCQHLDMQSRLRMPDLAECAIALLQVAL